MSILDHIKFNSEDPDNESLEDKIMAIKEILNDPPDGLWNYDMLESICIFWDDHKALTDKQQKQIEDAYEKWCI